MPKPVKPPKKIRINGFVPQPPATKKVVAPKRAAKKPVRGSVFDTKTLSAGNRIAKAGERQVAKEKRERNTVIRGSGFAGSGTRPASRIKVKKKSVWDRLLPVAALKAATGLTAKGAEQAAKGLSKIPSDLIGSAVPSSPGIIVPGAVVQSDAKGRGDIVKGAANLALIVPTTTVKNAVRDPGRTIGDVTKSAVSIPAGLIRATKDPSGALKAIEQDYVRRYKDAWLGNSKAFDKRQQREGAAAEVFDIAGLASGGTATGGRLLQNAAKAGTLGKTAERIATTTRKMRASGGDSSVFERDVSNNFLKNVGREVADQTRLYRQRRAVNRPNVDAVVKEATDAGQVVRSRRALARGQRRMVVRESGNANSAFKSEQSYEVLAGKRSTAATLRSLSKDERRGIKYAIQYGIRTPEQARRILQGNIDRVVRERKLAADRGEEVVIINDELPVMRKLIEDADRVFTPNLRRAAVKESYRSYRLGKTDPGLVDEQMIRRVYQPAGDLLGVAKREGETAAKYVKRVKAEMRKEGLGSAGYFKSEEIPRFRYAVFAKGGTRAINLDKTYTGRLTRLGLESSSPDVLIRQSAQNIKRRHNWNLVAKYVDQHALGWTGERNYSAYELERELRRRGIDPTSVLVYDAKRMRAERDATRESQIDAADPTMANVDVGKAYNKSVATLQDVLTNPSDFSKTGLRLIPKAAHKEIHANISPKNDGWLGRSYDITKGKVSRVILANPAWLGFQVASNTLMAGLAGVTPADFLRAQKFFRDAPPQIRQAHEAIFGVHGWYRDERHLGATADNRMVNGYRALKDTPFYRRAQKANPFDLFFRADNAQNNAFRKAVMYNRLKREAYRRMGDDASNMVKLQDQLSGMLAAGKREDVMRELYANRAIVEKHAQHVDDFLGNWTQYSAKERRTWARYAMFYGFLRFSTRLAFYTMPIKHPIMSSILLQIGRLEKDEINRIFGSVGGEPPPWEYGNFYGSDLSWGEAPKPGQKIDRFSTVRMVPFFNASSSLGNPSSLLGLASFVPVEIANQLYGKAGPLDKLYKINGQTTEVRKAGTIKPQDRLQIFLSDILNLSPYYRAAAKAFLPGAQGSDSSLILPQPIKYKRGDMVAVNNRRIAQQKKDGLLGAATKTLLPFGPSDATEQLDAARRFGAQKLKNERRNKKGKPVKLRRDNGTPDIPDIPDIPSVADIPDIPDIP